MNYQTKKLSKRQIAALQSCVDASGHEYRIGKATRDELESVFRIVGPCLGCVPDDEIGDEVAMDIIRKFRTVIAGAAQLASKRPPGSELEVVIEPSYDDATTVAVLDLVTKDVLFFERTKAWHYHFKSLREVANEVLRIADAIQPEKR